MSDEKDTVRPAETTELQRDEGRDERGRFARGNRYGWQRGESGNQAGRRNALSDVIRRKLAEPYDGTRTKREAVADALIDEAIHGSVRAAELLFTRLEGKMPTMSTVDINVSRSEYQIYEARVTELMQIADERGMPISKAKAVRLLSVTDPRVLAVLGEGEDE